MKKLLGVFPLAGLIAASSVHSMMVPGAQECSHGVMAFNADTASVRASPGSEVVRQNDGTVLRPTGHATLILRRFPEIH